jgi:hypothetical protein
MAHYPHLDRIFRHLRVLNLPNGSAGHQHQHHRDENRNNRPGQLNVRAAIDLGRLGAVVVVRTPEFHDDIDEDPGDK